MMSKSAKIKLLITVLSPQGRSPRLLCQEFFLYNNLAQMLRAQKLKVERRNIWGFSLISIPLSVHKQPDLTVVKYNFTALISPWLYYNAQVTVTSMNRKKITDKAAPKVSLRMPLNSIGFHVVMVLLLLYVKEESLIDVCFDLWI